jgi:hypothetical protein
MIMAKMPIRRCAPRAIQCGDPGSSRAWTQHERHADRHVKREKHQRPAGPEEHAEHDLCHAGESHDPLDDVGGGDYAV